MKKLFFLTLLSIFCLKSYAVLNETNLEQTIKVLKVELATTYSDLKQNTLLIKAASERQHKTMIQTMELSNQTALMLYSQKDSYTFNLAYACHEATQQYLDFTEHMLPYDAIIKRINGEISRYTHLIETLQALPPSLVPDKHKHFHKEAEHAHEHEADDDHENNAIDSLQHKLDEQKKKRLPFMLSDRGQKDRTICIKYAMSILNTYKTMKKEVSRDSEHYAHLKLHLQEIHTYAQQQYKDIQKSIFINGDENYFAILGHFNRTLRQIKRELTDKYENKSFQDNHIRSEWRGPIVFGLVLFVVFYISLAFLLSNIIVRILMKKISKLKANNNLQLKMDCIIVAASFFLFAIAMMVIKTFMKHNFIIMASELLISFSWLLTIIMTSLLIRLKGEEIKSALRLFMPIMVLGFIVIIFRIIFIPNTLVNIIFPPILMLFTLWQFIALKRTSKNVPLSDKIYSWVSLLLMCAACILAWCGYVLLSVQIFIWWLIQIMLILTVTCIYDILRSQEKRILKNTPQAKNISKKGWLNRNGEDIERSWFFDLLIMVVMPIGIVLSFVLSVYMSAQVFDLTETCIYVFQTPFVDIPDVCKLSLAKILLVIALYFIFNYICYLIKALYRNFKMKHLKRTNKGVAIATNQANFTLFYNITAIVSWGTYFILALIILQVPKSGISIVTAGLATGIGFAMKDLLENFFYGISLMTGRLRVGDWIECDGIRGKVDSITYQSTSIITDDGSIIAFLNSALFTKNFKNLTRNHLYEKSKIFVGVAYGSNIEQVRKVLVANISKMAQKNKGGRDIMDVKKGVAVSLVDFGESSVDLAVTYWTLVSDKVAFDCQVKETIYNTLNQHNIEIPFPQRDVRILANNNNATPAAQPQHKEKGKNKEKKNNNKTTSE